MIAESADLTSIETMEELSAIQTKMEDFSSSVDIEEVPPPPIETIEDFLSSYSDFFSWFQELNRIDHEWGGGLTAMALAALVLAWLLAVAIDFFADWCWGTSQVQDVKEQSSD